MARATPRSQVGILRYPFRADLSRGLDSGRARTAGTCRGLLAGETHLRTFVRVEEAGPTNDHAGRAPRHGVTDRKTSGGSDGGVGGRFAERVLSMVVTCRRHGVNVLDDRQGAEDIRADLLKVSWVRRPVGGG